MGKRAEYAASLAPLLADPSLRGSLEEYLVSRSNLPGPAANLELSWAFADLFSGRDPAPWQWEMLLGWAPSSRTRPLLTYPRSSCPYAPSRPWAPATRGGGLPAGGGRGPS